MRSGRLRWLSAIGLLGGISAFPQVSPDLEQGMKPFGSYQGGDLDHISMSNGNLFFLADLLAYAQRSGELGYRIVLQYNGENFNLFQYTCPSGTKANQCPQYLVFGPPWAASNISRGNSVTVGVEGLPTVVPAGAKINTGLSLNGQPIYVQLNSVLTEDGSLHPLANTSSGSVTLDGSGFTTLNGYLVDRHGNKYSSTIAEDANGNQINYSTGADTLNRQMPAMPGPSGNYAITSVNTPPASTASLNACPSLGYPNQSVSYAYTWNLPTVNGGTLPLTLCYASVYVNTGTSGEYLHQVNGSFAMLQSVVFPDNTYWAFQYDAGDPNNSSVIAWGELLKITLPTGGSIAYIWGPCSCTTAFARSVMTRSVDANDGNGPQTWHYSYNNASFTIVQDPLGNETTHSLTNLGGSLSSFYEIQAQYFQGSHTSGTLLKTVNTDYQFQMNAYDSGYMTSGGNLAASDSVTNVFPIRVTTTLPNGLVSKTETDYDSALAYHGPLDGIQYNDQTCWTDDVANPPVTYCNYTTPTTMPVTNYTGSYGKVIATREYDWGQGAPGPLLRQTFTNYLWQGNSNYLAYNFLDLISSSTVQDGGGDQVAQTTYGYDEYALNPSGISTQRNANPSNGSIRGNQTSVHHWLNGSTSATPSCPISVSNGFVSGYNIFNDTGTVYKSTDACGSSAGDPNHTTTHSYSSSYAGAYPTQTCLPTVNNITQCVSGTYDFNTGLLASLSDANGQTTNYSYDNRWRMTQALFPAIDSSGVRPETDFYYPNATTVQRCKKQNDNSSSSSACGTGWIVDYAYFDGLGRTKQTRLVDPAGDDYVDTTYDVLGRVSTVSNPYHNNSTNSTDGITTSHYDALSRLTSVTKQDGSVSSVQYDLAAGTANCTMSTDEAGKQRKTCSDGLGRLMKVWEDPAGLSFETDYQYDTLGNLLRVDQKGSAPGNSTQWRTRLFTYDSLSRLLSAQNPESGTITYQYDNAGNMVYKGDPRGSHITYAYDQLNRLILKTPSDGTTPIVNYSYDQTSAWGHTLTNGIGRMTSEGVFPAWGQPYIQAALFGYDALGHMTNEWDCLPSTCPSSITFPISAAYNLAGEMTSLTYPDGQVINYSYDVAAHSLSAIGADNTNYVYNSTYYPNGAQYRQWWTPNIYARTDLNNRLQVAAFYSDNGVTPAYYLSKTYSYGSQNNGNVLAIYNNKDTSRTQSFTYDSLNRLTHAETSGTDCTQILPDGHTEYWGNNYVYDAWGNLYQKNVTKCSAENLQASVTAQNRLTGYSYDAAGNMTGDGINTAAYDAENRLTQVSSGNATYLYDSEGNRVRKNAGSVSTEYVYFGGNVIAERNPSAATWTDYIFFNGKRVGRRDPSGAVHYYLSDHLGSTAMVVSAAGAIENESDYYPWGGELKISAADSGNHYKFTGKERDNESGLDYFGARYYGNALGRWMSPDWAAKATAIPYADFSNPQSLNLYRYPSNPETYADADGHKDGECGFWCKAGNFYNYGVWGDDKAVEKAEQAARAQLAADQERRVELGILPMVYDSGQKDSKGRPIYTDNPDSMTRDAVMHPHGTNWGSAITMLGAAGLIKGGTYYLVDAETGKIMYTGKSNDLGRRRSEHARSEDKGDLNFRVDKRTDDPAARSGREQINYDRYKPPLNQRRPVGPNNPRLQEYLKAGAMLED